MAELKAISEFLYTIENTTEEFKKQLPGIIRELEKKTNISGISILDETSNTRSGTDKYDYIIEHGSIAVYRQEVYGEDDYSDRKFVERVSYKFFAATLKLENLLKVAKKLGQIK